MTQLVLYESPIQIILASVESKEERLFKQFEYEIVKLYQYEIFKPMLDLCATFCLQSRLKFIIQNKQFFEFDEGNCLTIEGSVINSLLNKFKSEKKYTITVKKISTDVIVHEIAHMIEKEGDFNNLDAFENEVIRDIKSNNTDNVSLRNAVKHIMIDEVKSYPSSQKYAEHFARFFQLIAMSKEVMGKNMSYFYNLDNICTYFTHTTSFLSTDFYKTILNKINPHIANQSALYIKRIEDINHKWSDAQKPIHDEKPSWSKSLKSIKD